MYIVTKNNPYYPSVIYCGTLEDAQHKAKEWLKEMHDPGAPNACKITIAKIEQSFEFRSAY